jgi:homoserine O-succinyltransferase
MPLVLPDSHPAHALEGVGPLGSAQARTEDPIRIGIINVMPKLEAYEPLLLAPLARVRRAIEPVFVRLESHAYHSSDLGHLERFYRTFAAEQGKGPLDGLILTGAPVEELPFEEVRYWEELSAILEVARRSIRSTLGLCWGGLALGALLGVPKTRLPRKLFGVFENRPVDPSQPLLANQGERFWCAHSRHSGILDADLEQVAADGRVRPLSYAPETGYSLFESPDHRFVMHLGHPEYVADRLVFEWERDRTLGRADVDPPQNFDPAAPVTSWHSHREAFLESWVSLVSERRVDDAAPDP